jgi:hypothetical protein
MLSKKLLEASKKFPLVAVTGPRQSGKTTLAKSVFPKKPYISLEDLDVREFAVSDPRGFLAGYPQGAILDEVQRAPQLFSYLQTIVDARDKPGLFILTGSQNFLLMEKLSQTLAGRVHLLDLLPFSLEELDGTTLMPSTPEDWIFKGMYPRVRDKRINPVDWCHSYIRTYLEREVRLIKNITDAAAFQRFLKMCAARTGQLLNLSSLADDCGITHNTAKAWIGILEASFIVYLLYPHHRNFSKRLIKMPKLYFFDTALVCSLLGIRRGQELKTHALRGNLFETAVISELVKQRRHRGIPGPCYFWRDKLGNEVDCLIEKGTRLIPIEIKSGRTVTVDFFKGLSYWLKMARSFSGQAYLVYAGEQGQQREKMDVLSWKQLPSFSAHL